MRLLMALSALACLLTLAAGLAARRRLSRRPVPGSPLPPDPPSGPAALPRHWVPLARVLLGPERRVLSLAMALTLWDTLLALAAPWPLMLVVDYGLSHRPYPSWLAGAGRLSPAVLALAAAAAGLLLLALGGVAGYLVTFLTGVTAERVAARLRAAVVAHLLRIPPRDAARYPAGELLNRISADTLRVSDMVLGIADTLLPDVALLSGMILITALVDWRLTLVVLGVLPLYALLARRRNRALKGAQRRARQLSGELSASTADLLARIPAVHVFGRADAEAAQYHQASTGSAAAEVAALDASARFGPAADLLPGLAMAAALVVGATEVTAGRLTVGGLLVFLAYLSSLTGPVRGLAQLSTTITRGSASRDRLAELLAHRPLQPLTPALPARAACPSPARRARTGPPAHPGLLARGRGAPEVRPVRTAPAAREHPTGTVTLARRAPATRDQRARGAGRRMASAVRVDGVTFAHRPGELILDRVSLQVRAGEFLCVTGPSGSGKSTLLSLLVRLAEPDDGRISIGGAGIAQIPLRRLRDLVTLVPQDPWLHTGTIADNIRYGRPGASRGQVLDAAQRAGVAAFAGGLPDGYDTLVGEHGRELSGGQQRRVAIARALLCAAPVLLLDEPTAGLDPATEERLIGDLLAGRRTSTLILVTHQPRLQTLADRVVRLDHGRIA